ncbi:MAG: TIGR00730 family Rossman fold protein [Bacteroidetes bacterium]|nr:TIGR00730 family Rossman fold protein [Bacteroidota bacterium]
MKKDFNVEKAYKNMKFITSPEARAIRILSEYYEPKTRFEKAKIDHTIVFFGSARLKSESETKKNIREIKKKYKDSKSLKSKLEEAEKKLKMSRYYEDAVELSKRLTEWTIDTPKNSEKFMICSGGGPGIMEAANKGAKLGGGESIGLNISIPFEQFVNKYVEPENAFEFHYFFMRKLWFVDLASALIVFPGGFGTFDEMMEVLTLVQTGKIKKKLKIVVYDSEYWNKVINFNGLVETGVISKSDLDLFEICDSVDEIYKTVTDHFEKYYL